MAQPQDMANLMEVGLKRIAGVINHNLALAVGEPITLDPSWANINSCADNRTIGTVEIIIIEPNARTTSAKRGLLKPYSSDHGPGLKRI